MSSHSGSAKQGGKGRAKAPKPPVEPTTTLRLSGAESIVKTLEYLGVDVVFGLPGGAVLPLYDPLLDAEKLRHILVRHEQGAGHAATGYAQATGRVGVCIATSGPGATNLVTPIADAHMDSVPLVAITGQVGQTLLGSDAFQEADITGITAPICKHSFIITDPAKIPETLAKAFHLATTGRPGPVLVDIPKDVQQSMTTFSWPVRVDMLGYRPVTEPNAKAIRAAADLIAQANKPVLYIGGGVIKAEAEQALAAFVKLTGIPVVTTLMARGAFPDSHALHMGMPGMHGSVAAVAAMQRSDLLITIGARFDDRVTGELSTFAPEALVIHADIDPVELGKIRHADAPIVGDAKRVLEELTTQVAADYKAKKRTSITGWVDYLTGLKTRFPLGWEPQSDGSMSPQFVIKALSEAVGTEAIYCAGVGQHQMWAAQFVTYDKPRTWLNSGGLGTMGYAVPAAMGAKVGCPEAEVWAIDGDGCFQMTNQELVTCAVEGIPIKVALINNGNLGMVRQWQTLFYDHRYSNTDLKTHSLRIPDFVKLAEAMGCVALRCEREADVAGVIAQARAVTDRPVVIDFIVGQDAQVWPMVAAGTSNDEVMSAVGVRPLLDDENSAGESPAAIHDVLEEAAEEAAAQPAPQASSAAANERTDRSDSRVKKESI